MAFDAHKNFAYSTVATAPSPASSGTSLVVASGEGAAFPAVPFNATVWPAGSQPTAANAEIVRVTNITTDTFTIARTQESTSARSIGVGDQIAATITAKTLTDIENVAKLFDQTLTGTASSIDTGAGGIPAGYSSLLIVAYLRSDRSATSDKALWRFNNDSGSNYYTSWAYSGGNANSNAEFLAVTGLELECLAASATANLFAAHELRVPQYAAAFIKAATGTFFAPEGTGSGSNFTASVGGWWNSTAAITRVAVVSANSANFIAGSRVTIYGFS